MKLKLILLVVLLLIPFSIEARDYKPSECCNWCVEWKELPNGKLICKKMDYLCPCPEKNRPTPAYYCDNDINTVSRWYQKAKYRPPILSRGFVAMGIIPVNERDIAILLLLTALFFGVFALLVDIFVGLRFWRWRE